MLFDCPGQVELFTLHDSLLAILAVMNKQWHFRWRPRCPSDRSSALCVGRRTITISHA